MSNEISVLTQLSCNNGAFNLNLIRSMHVDQSGVGGGAPGLVNIGTSEEDIAFSDITTPGWVLMWNLDPTNFVKWGPKNGAAMVELGRLLPDGEPACFRLAPSGVTLRMVADTAACNVYICVLKN